MVISPARRYAADRKSCEAGSLEGFAAVCVVYRTQSNAATSGLMPSTLYVVEIASAVSNASCQLRR